VNVVNGTNTCEMSSCSDGVSLPNASHNSCNSNINAGSRLYPNNADLSEITLRTSTHSTSQVLTPPFHPAPRPILLPEKNPRGTQVGFGFPSDKRAVRQTVVVECV
jgi:hypothetical protein